MATELEKFSQFEILYNGDGALPCVAYKLTPGEHGFSLYDLSDRVRMKGWQIASYPLPADRDNTVVQRILVRRGVSRDMASLLLDAIKDCLVYFAENPVSSKTAKAGYHHQEETQEDHHPCHFGLVSDHGPA